MPATACMPTPRSPDWPSARRSTCGWRCSASLRASSRPAPTATSTRRWRRTRSLQTTSPSSTGAPALGDAVAQRWRLALADGEAQALRAGVHLPLVALRQAGARALEIELLLVAGLVEED